MIETLFLLFSFLFGYISCYFIMTYGVKQDKDD
jgi:hypothetical protein